MLVACSAGAHEIGTTRVDVMFLRSHTYRIELRTSPESLQRRHATPQTIADAIDVDFDGRRVTPHLTMGMPIVLTGEIPARAATFTWRYRMTFASYALTVNNDGGVAQTQWISADDMSKPFALSRAVQTPSRLDVIRQYLFLGFTHIVPYGLDHILFVLGIFLLSMRIRPVLTQVTAFTIAHSITLGLTIYGVVSVSPRIVEPMIALSIAYIAIENVTTTKVRASRVAVVFAFGLLHGMGFAGVLKELGLPRSRFLSALVSFNVGVECGQLAVIVTAFVLFGWWAVRRPAYRRHFVIPASSAIAAIGIFWTVQRTLF